jgi:hypothetical protein
MSTIFVLNPQSQAIDLYQAMADRLTKTQALMNLALNEQLYEAVSIDHQHYLWVIADLLDEAKLLSAALLNEPKCGE